ncbi:MAG: TRAP transporter small permease [Rhodobacteraceae bacterium]|nr:TRAP transporter small permease [Paracoccaceae bacterium]
MTHPRWAERVLAYVFTLESVIAVAGYAIVAGLLVVDVALRELVGTSVYGAQRISVYVMIITGFLGLGLAAAQGRHLRPRFADGLIPTGLTRAATRLGDLIMTAVLLGFAWIGVRFVLEAHEFEDMARIIDIPLWYLHLIVPYAFATTALRYALFALYPALRPEEVSSE